MGGVETKPRLLNQKISTRYERLDIDELDNFWAEAFLIARDVEMLRCEFILKWNEFLRHTGGVVLKNPRFEACVQGMLWKFAADMGGTLSSIDIMEQDPFINFRDKGVLKDEDIQIMGTFINLCRFYSQNTERVYKLEADLQKYSKDSEAFLRDTETFLTDKHNVAPINFYMQERKLINNSRKIKQSYLVAVDIRDKFEDIRRGLSRYSNWIKIPEQMKSFESVGIDANMRKISKATRLLYKYSKEEKVSTYEDHIDLIQDQLKAEKEARLILDELQVKTTTLIRPSKTAPIFLEKKEARYPTGQTTSTIRKETAASQGEIYPVETQGVVITNEERERDEIPSTSMTKEIRQSVRDVEQPEYAISERDMGSKYYVVRDIDYDQEKKDLKEREFSRPQSKTIVYTNYDQTTVPQYTKTTTGVQPVVQLSQPVLPSIQSSQFILPVVQPIKSASEKNLQAYGNGVTYKTKENVGIENVNYDYNVKTTGISGISEIKQPSTLPDYYELQKQIDLLRKQNEDLTLKLSQVSVEPTVYQSQMMQPSQVSKNLPVFIKQHVPLKNWNLFCKKTAESSQNQPVKTMEAALDMDYIITGLTDGNLVFWKFPNFSTITEHKVMSLGQTPVKSLLYLNDGKTLLCGLKDGKIMKCDITLFSSKMVSELDLNFPVNGMVNPLNGYSIYAGCGNKIYEVDFVNNKIINSVEAHDLPITDIAYNQQKELLCTSGKDKFVKVWNANTKECLGILQGHVDIVNSITFAYTHEHLILASVAKDSYITFWNLTDKKLTKSLKMNSPAEKVVYLWDKKTVLTVHEKGLFTLWDIEKNEVREFSNENNPLNYSNGLYCDDGANIILAGARGSLEFWNAK